MSETDIPAGWQPDPRGRHEYRYWDGTQWTDHVSDKGEVSQDPVADVSPAAETPAAAATEPTPDPVPTQVQPSVTAHEPEPAREPEPVAAREPEPQAAPHVPPTASAAPPAGATAPSTQQTEAKAAAQQVLHSKSPELATILSVVAPGSGHFYMGASNAVPIGAGLLVATLVAVVLAYMSFPLFIVGFVIWLAAAAFAVHDLRGGMQSVQDVALPPNIVGILLIAAGVLMLVAIFLPFYHVEVDAGAFGSVGGNVSGWDAFEIIRLVWLAVAIASIVAGAASLGLGPVTTAELPTWLPMAVAVGGAVAALLTLFRMFVDVVPGLPDGAPNVDFSIGRAPGALLLLSAALVIVLSNLGLLRSPSDKNRQAV